MKKKIYYLQLELCGNDNKRTKYEMQLFQEILNVYVIVIIKYYYYYFQ